MALSNNIPQTIEWCDNIHIEYIDLSIIVMCPVSGGESKFFKGENNVIYTLRAPFHIGA